MSEAQLLEQVTSEILHHHADRRTADQGAETGWAPDLWATLEQAGLPLVGIPENRGGAGGGWLEIAAVLRAVGRYAAPVPLAESAALAGWLLAEAALAIPDGPLTIAPVRVDDTVQIVPDGEGWRLRGSAARVPWASQAAGIVVLAAHGDAWMTGCVPPSACRVEAGVNLAGEPRDRVDFEGVHLERAAVAPVSIDLDALLVRGALVRAIQMAGALDRVLELTVEYTQARVQFGRPLGRFQAVQQELARLAGEAVASAAAVEAAVLAAAKGECTMEVAAAKVRTAEAAALGTRIGHQLHGAIGFTQEHPLHRVTSRLWSWRDEFGSEREWAGRLGRFAAASGPAGFWGWLTHTSGGTTA